VRPPAIQFVFDPRAFDRAFTGPAVWVLEATEPIHDSARRVLAAHLEVDSATIALAKDPHGRLFVDAAMMPDCARAAEIDVSVSHAAGIQVIGVAFGGRIGVDVEAHDHDIDVAALSRDHFTPSEQAHLMALQPSDRVDHFYHLWTTKEAIAKAIGHGFSLGLDMIELSMSDGSCHISRIAGNAHLAAGWRVTQRRYSHHGRSFLIAAATGSTKL
jgi:phosphopantetheine--protein transferase-like protein